MLTLVVNRVSFNSTLSLKEEAFHAKGTVKGRNDHRARITRPESPADHGPFSSGDVIRFTGENRRGFLR